MVINPFTVRMYWQIWDMQSTEGIKIKQLVIFKNLDKSTKEF